MSEFSTPSNDVTIDEDKSNALNEVNLGNKLKRLRDVMNDKSTYDKLPQAARTKIEDSYLALTLQGLDDEF